MSASASDTGRDRENGPSFPGAGALSMRTDWPSRAAAIPWLAAGLCLTRVRVLDHTLVTEGLACTGDVLSELGALPPPGFVVDVAHLLGGGRLDTSKASAVAHTPLRDALGRYEDRVLGRLVADRRWSAAQDAYAALPAHLKPAAVAVLVARLAQASGELEVVEAGVVRQLARRHPDDVLSIGLEAWEGVPQALHGLARGYEALVEVARVSRSMLTDADVFVLENLDVLSEMGQRVAIAQVVDAAEELARRWPRRIKLKLRPAGQAATSLEDESAYPTGGFSSVATRGSLENLVSSELVYMDHADERGDGVDLFDVRYAEGELLYYTRDEALIVRRRRLVAFVLREDLERARVKDADAPWQRVVLLLGWILAAVRRLEKWLGADELRFLCVVERSIEHRPTLEHEHQLLELMLTEWRDRGIAEVVIANETQWKERLQVETGRADVRAAVLSSEVAPPPDVPDGVEVVSWGAEARPLSAWCTEGLAVLKSLV